MDNYYLYIVIILLALALVDLVVGVSNNAVNFLNSAIGSHVAPRYVIMIVASLGIVIGSLMSSGMMEIARKGIFHPDQFYFSEIMIIFMAVMITDIILLDIFNTFGLPTSTTVSLVFELLGSAVAVASVKILSNDGTLAMLGQYINTEKALMIISGILISVVVAFVTGTVVMYFSRIVFSFNLRRSYHYFGALFGGFAITALTYFIIMKGIGGATMVPPSFIEALHQNTIKILLISFLGWAILLQLLSVFFRFNIFKAVVLLGTFALALSFAGNDLVNFIGVPMAGLKSFQIYMANPGIAPDQLNMSELAGPVNTNFYYLVIAGLVMVITLWFSKKARTVTETEVGLARQDSGIEQFGSTHLSRSIVRQTMHFASTLNRIIPTPIERFLDRRFDQNKAKKVKVGKDGAPSFDLIRASVNLTTASILISMATSLKLPLSTTYVTFMVAMGSSLADKAWGRESAVYRITGVLTVISGWFFTAFVAFTVALLVALAISFGGKFAVIAIIGITIFVIP
ncbi:inorganic phosphate transporter [Williamwhitmania taraxaci]|uniref:Phosphate transporter n=1 Tax=Williamwhitmania taraxaci TaxID=1640674 RepID=A0A1G6N1K4_9BACT|nr:inorganic phosphate transporter [Williamwhitmania taraxaci]SDC61718.1 Phosphate transporter family protein [Williamwhitmania taraxaci]